MNQGLIAALALVFFSGFALGCYIAYVERKSREAAPDVHSGRSDVETRARREF